MILDLSTDIFWRLIQKNNCSVNLQAALTLICNIVSAVQLIFTNPDFQRAENIACVSHSHIKNYKADVGMGVNKNRSKTYLHQVKTKVTQYTTSVEVTQQCNYFYQN
jgi:hypothetical protein